MTDYEKLRSLIATRVPDEVLKLEMLKLLDAIASESNEQHRTVESLREAYERVLRR